MKLRQWNAIDFPKDVNVEYEKLSQWVLGIVKKRELPRIKISEHRAPDGPVIYTRISIQHSATTTPEEILLPKPVITISRADLETQLTSKVI